MQTQHSAKTAREVRSTLHGAVSPSLHPGGHLSTSGSGMTAEAERELRDLEGHAGAEKGLNTGRERV